jgi:hypothetical protein
VNHAGLFARLTTREFVPLWPLFILPATFAFVVSPAAVVGVSDVFGHFFDCNGFPESSRLAFLPWWAANW